MFVPHLHKFSLVNLERTVIRFLSNVICKNQRLNIGCWSPEATFYFGINSSHTHTHTLSENQKFPSVAEFEDRFQHTHIRRETVYRHHTTDIRCFTSIPKKFNSYVSVPTHVNTFRTCGQPIQQRNISKPGHVPLNCIRRCE